MSKQQQIELMRQKTLKKQILKTSIFSNSHIKAGEVRKGTKWKNMNI